MEIKKIKKTIVIIFLLFFLASCNKGTKKAIKNSERKTENITLNQVSISGNDYGSIVGPPINVKRDIIKNKTYSLFIYKIEKNDNVDSLFVYNNGVVIFDNKKLILIDKKKVKVNNKDMVVKKLFVPADKFPGTDSDGKAIVYICDDGLIVNYGLYFRRAFLYDPSKYSELQKSILNRDANFKRDKEELNIKP